MGGYMEDVIARRFLADIEAFANERFERYREQIRAEYAAGCMKDGESFLACLEDLAGRYRRLEEQAVTGAVRGIYLSFMRTSILLDVPPYRIDLYDERGRRSVVECAGGWDFGLVYGYFREMKAELEQRFGRQTRVRGYVLDGMLYDLGGRFHRVARELIPGMIAGVGERIREIEGLEGDVRVYLGEFLDRAEVVWGGGSGLLEKSL